MKHKKDFLSKSELRKMVSDLEIMLGCRTNILKTAIKNKEISYEENIQKSDTLFELIRVGRYVSQNNYLEKYDDYEKKVFMFFPSYYKVEYFSLESENE